MHMLRGCEMRLEEFKVISPGNCSADAAVCGMPLSFWGGVDTGTGKIIDVHHTDCGTCISGKVLCIPYDRGSCSGSGVMLEMIRLGTAPVAILCIEAEPVLALAPMIGKRLYDRTVPIRTIDKEAYEKIPRSGGRITFTDDAVIIE